MTNTWIDIHLQEMLARDGGSHSLVVFTAPVRSQASATMEQTASQVHGLHAKMGCKLEWRKKGLEQRLFVEVAIGKGCWPHSFYRSHLLNLCLLTLLQRDWAPGWKSKEHTSSLPEITQGVNLSLISIIGWKPGILIPFRTDGWSYYFLCWISHWGWKQIHIQAESKNNLRILKALTRTAKAFAAHAADVK